MASFERRRLSFLFAVAVLVGCGSTDEPTVAAPGYGSEGPATVEELEACFATQPGEVTLTRNPRNGSIEPAELDPPLAGGLVASELIVDGQVDGMDPVKAIKKRTAEAGLTEYEPFEPYRSGTFVVHSKIWPKTIDPANHPEYKVVLDACLPPSPAK